jgi:hypothetical protein
MNRRCLLSSDMVETTANELSGENLSVPCTGAIWQEPFSAPVLPVVPILEIANIVRGKP